MNLEPNPVIEKLETKFLGFGSCFAQNLQRLLEPFHFLFTSTEVFVPFTLPHHLGKHLYGLLKVVAIPI